MNTEGSLTKSMQLETAVENALQTDPGATQSPITVAVQGSTVTLTGRVDTEQAKEAAEKIAYSVPGVLDVTNELVVGRDDDGGIFGIGLGRGRNDDNRNDNVFPGVLGVAAVPGNVGGGTGTGGSGMGGVLPVIAPDIDGGATRSNDDTEEVNG